MVIVNLLPFKGNPPYINGIDMQLHMYEKIAGYVRMNAASHETENSGPLTAERFERDYGYVDHKLEPIGYNMVNNMGNARKELVKRTI